MTWIILFFVSAALSWLITLLVRRQAARIGLIATVNSRSSHVKSTPTGGGTGFVLSGTATGLWLFFYYDVPYTNLVLITILSLGLLLALLGLRDDIRPVGVRIRAGTQFLTCLSLLSIINALPPLTIPLWFESQNFFSGVVSISGLFLYCLVLLTGVWWINLFNFMDGIDGLAATQAIFMIAAGGGLTVWGHAETMTNPIWLWTIAVLGATLAFAIMNWPPATIFMGDIGSTWLAFVIFALALVSIQAGWSTYGLWLILGATFIVDATLTLCTRMLRGQRWYSAHRSHAYQRLARHLQCHRAATLLYCAINVFYLLPLALLHTIWPNFSLLFLICAYLPLSLGALRVGAGKN